MLQHTEIEQRFSRIERDINEVESGCQSNATLPQDLKDCVAQWKKHATHTKDVLESKSERKIARCIDDLEEIGGRTEMALQTVTNIDARIRDSVLHAHSELVDLKKKLH
jgi:polyhydroxyalkanoate synthesis regulator phasin